MSLDILYPLITEAIRRAEVLDDLRAPGARRAYLDLSCLEEKVAELLPASNPEGALARRGAVRAALTAGDFTRAQHLVKRYLAEGEIDSELRFTLRRLLEQAEQKNAARFPLVSAAIGMIEVRRVARALYEQAAPFPIP